MGSMRDLDQIQERDDAGRSSKLMSIALGGMAAACVLFAVGVIVGRESGDPRPVPREDPLARLDQLAQQPERGAPAPSGYAEHLTGSPVGNATTAALATAEGAAARPAPGSTPTAAGAAPALAGPSLADPGNRPVLLPSAPVGAPGALGAVPGGIRLHDATALPGAPAAGGAPVAPGSDGVLTVQVSAFRSQGPAEGLRSASASAGTTPTWPSPPRALGVCSGTASGWAPSPTPARRPSSARSLNSASTCPRCSSAAPPPTPSPRVAPRRPPPPPPDLSIIFRSPKYAGDDADRASLLRRAFGEFARRAGPSPRYGQSDARPRNTTWSTWRARVGARTCHRGPLATITAKESRRPAPSALPTNQV